jgi:alkylated DNA repair dioxygenase AlkB
MTALSQPDLFQAPPSVPEGLSYRRDLIEPDEEQALVREIERLPLKPFEFHGYLGKRRVVSFGWRYDYNEAALKEAGEIPAFLLPLRERAARFAGLAPEALDHALVTEYAPGAGIGWHRDRPQFDEVIGISLLTSCVLRFRRELGQGWERRFLQAEPRSAYLLTGPSRREWQHSIASVDALRYSVTFRRLKA